MDKKYNLYLDDKRTPTTDEWLIVRNFTEFKSKIEELGLDNIAYISLDHDLDETAEEEYINNGIPNYTINYSNIGGDTGMECAKWLVDHFYSTKPEYDRELKKDRNTKSLFFPFPKVYVHADNPIGACNIMGYINNFLMNENQPKDCVSVSIEHT